MKKATMMRVLPPLLLPLAVVSATTPESCTGREDDGSCEWVESAAAECGLWMAPSTLGEGANLGMYAGRAFAADTVLQEEMAIPLLFRDFEDTLYWSQVQGGKTEKDDGSLWHRYIWNGWVAHIETYHIQNSQDSRAVFVPGIGCTINSILDMKNVDSAHGSVYDTVGVPRSHPNAGAFTPYHKSATKSVTEIPAGAEIFTDYGDGWIPDIPGAQITFDRIIDQAEDFLRDDYYPFVKQHSQQNSSITPQFWEALWNFTRDFPHPNPQTFSVLPRQVTWQQIQQNLEDNFQQEKEIYKNTIITRAADPTYDPPPPYYTEKTSVVRHFIRQLGKRDIQWLQQHGRCSDHIRPGNSTIPYAGRGAFANRHLPKGTIVGYSPLVHVGLYGEDLYQVQYEFNPGDADDDNAVYHRKNYNKTDLILNYAFGHPDSTILLSPYGSMVNYINHAPADKANVRVVWPSTEMVAHKPEWLTKDIHFIANTIFKIGLSFDYVALRDIQEGEELFMDYGPEWEAAWNEHVQSWVPPEDADEYVHSSQWTEPTFRTEREQANNPYPSNLVTVCLPAFMWDPIRKAHYFSPLDKEYIDRRVCVIKDRKDPASKDDDDEQPQQEVYTVEFTYEEKRVQVFDFPRDHILLTDRVMSQDWHLPNTFRHWMSIPDDIFPQSWKNRVGVEEEEEEAEEEGSK